MANNDERRQTAMASDLSTEDERLLDKLQRAAFQYFLHESNPHNGLVADSTSQGAPASIAAVGLALAAYSSGVERGYLSRQKAIQRTLTTLRFFAESPHSAAPDATGYRGFYYHFLDMRTGARTWQSELSSIDTALLLAGALAAAAYFNGDAADERMIREWAEALYQRADWQWMQHGKPLVAHGWRPEKGFLRYRWEGYSEALLLYLLGLASPTHPLPAASYAAWLASYAWREIYGHEFVYAGPLFIHQLSHVWVDLRGIQDAYMRAKGIDYFENSRRATYVQQQYAIHNPHGFHGYGEHMWGISAGAGPGPARRRMGGIARRFYGYRARGVPDGPDDGTLSPWGVIASLPFAPELVLPTIRALNEQYPQVTSKYGFKCSFNPTFPSMDGDGKGWVSAGYYGLEQGPVVLMIENYRSGLLWRLMRGCPHIRLGLQQAGFTGGWLA